MWRLFCHCLSLISSSVGTDGWRMAINVYGRTHRGPVCDFGFRSPLSPLLCFITACYHICFTVMIHRLGRGPLCVFCSYVTFFVIIYPHLSFFCVSGRLCFVIVAFPGYLHLYFCLLSGGGWMVRHRSVQLILAYNLAKPVILVAGKGRGEMF